MYLRPIPTAPKSTNSKRRPVQLECALVLGLHHHHHHYLLMILCIVCWPAAAAAAAAAEAAAFSSAKIDLNTPNGFACASYGRQHIAHSAAVR